MIGPQVDEISLLGHFLTMFFSQLPSDSTAASSTFESLDAKYLVTEKISRGRRGEVEHAGTAW